MLPGMEAAFVDIGLERAAFLHVSDIRPENPPEADAAGSDRSAPVITELVREGQELVAVSYTHLRQFYRSDDHRQRRIHPPGQSPGRQGG